MTSFTFEHAGDSKRQAYRASLPGLCLRLAGDTAERPLRDVSVGGLSLDDESDVFAQDARLEFDILILGKVVVRGLAGVVARRQGAMAGIRFEGLDQNQEQRLDKLVLEIQKYVIRKAKEQETHCDGEKT